MALPNQNIMTNNLPQGFQQLPRFSAQQLGAQNAGLQQVMSLLGNRQNLDFAPQAQLAREQFQTQTIPSIANRFTAMGGQSRLGSSGFADMIGSSAANLESQLAALGSQYGLQREGQQNQLLTALLQLGLQPQFETAYTPQQPGFGSQFAGALGGGLGMAIPGLLAGGPLGAGLGGLAGLLSQFGRGNQQSHATTGLYPQPGGGYNAPIFNLLNQRGF